MVVWWRQEAPGRLTAIMGKLQNPRIFDKVELSVSEDFAAAPFQLLAQVCTQSIEGLLSLLMCSS